jgi:hypothetical protein
LIESQKFLQMGEMLRFIIDVAEYEHLCVNEKNRDCLMPYLTGEDVNRSPTQSHERYAINFRAEPLVYAEQYPDLLQIIRERVLPERLKAKDHGPGKHGKKYWWQHTLRRDPLFEAIDGLDKCLVAAITTSHLSFSFQPIRQVFSHAVVVFAFDTFAPFACLQSTVHSIWANVFSSSLEDRLRYSINDVFQTFPFPKDVATNKSVERRGRDYYDFRESIMITCQAGLTTIYNRFHDPHEQSSEILHLRELHAAMDRAVLEAYGWDDLAAAARCEFLLNYEEEEDNEPGAKKSKKKKPWRYRWPDDFRDEVLARLLELNEHRAREERLAGNATASARKPRSATTARAKAGKTKQQDESAPLFEGM